METFYSKNSLKDKLLDASPPSVSPVDEDLLERYVVGAASLFEAEIVEVECALSPAFAASVQELQEFASQLYSYDWSALNARLGTAQEKPTLRFLASDLIKLFSLRREALAEPFQIRQTVLQHATDDAWDAMMRQPLHFAEDRVIGSFTVAEEGFHIHIEHTDWSAGTLALLEITEVSGAPILQRFIVFKEDWERAAVDAVIPRFDNVTSMIALIEVDPEQMNAEAIPALEQDCIEALNSDEESSAAWNFWATQFLVNHRAGPVREAAMRILKSTTSG